MGASVGDEYGNAVKEQVCYFKNMSALSKRQRKVREQLVLSNLRSLHQEWREHIARRYPNPTPVEPIQKQSSSKKVLPIKRSGTQQLPLEKEAPISIQVLIESAKRLRQKVHVDLLPPRPEKPQDSQTFKSICEDYIERVYLLLTEFADDQYQFEEKGGKKLQVFVKAISKDILILVQIPAQNSLQQSFEQNEEVRLQYFKFDRSKCRVTPTTLAQKDIWVFLTTHTLKPKKQKSFHFARNRLTSEPRGAWQNRSTDNFKHLADQSVLQMHISMPASRFPRQRTASETFKIDEVASLRQARCNFDNQKVFSINRDFERTSVESSDVNAQVRQINLPEELMHYNFKHQRNYSKRQLQFENKVRVIINNFVRYLTESLKIAFSESVLKGLRSPEDLRVQKSLLQKKDFVQAVQAMGEVSFSVDLSFMVLFRNHIDKHVFAS